MLKQMTDATVHLSKQMLSTGRAIGMTVDDITSKLEAETEALIGFMNHDCRSASLLARRYAARCKQVVEDPDSIFTEYLPRR